jgi:hypothetical protein
MLGRRPRQVNAPVGRMWRQEKRLHPLQPRGRESGKVASSYGLAEDKSTNGGGYTH